MEKTSGYWLTSLLKNNIQNWIIYLTILIAIIISALIYLLPFQEEFSVKEKVAKIYFADNITAAHTEIIKRFNNIYKGKIEVIPVEIPTIKFTTNKRKELITRSLRSRNSRIDVFAIDQIWVPRFAKWAEPLDNYFNEQELSKILPQALNTCSYQGQLFAIPFFIDVGVMFYRKDIIDKLENAKQLKLNLFNGISWDDLLELRSKYFKGKNIYVFQGDAYEGLICNYLELLGSIGGSIYNGDRFIVNNNVNIKCAHQLFDLIYKDNLIDRNVADFDESKSFEYAFQHDIPFFRGWPTTLKYSNLISKTTSKLNLLEVAPVLKVKGLTSKATIGGWNFILSRFSNVKKEAVIFIKFIISEQVQELNYNSGYYLPILKPFYDDKKFIERYPILNKQFLSIIQNGLTRPAHIDYTRVSDILAYYLNKIIRKELAVEEALNFAQEQIDKTVNNP
jgi:multiple sugar transport system substrate-binding protein